MKDFNNYPLISSISSYVDTRTWLIIVQPEYIRGFLHALMLSEIMHDGEYHDELKLLYDCAVLDCMLAKGMI